MLLDALSAVFAHTKAAESVLTKNYEEHVNALVQYLELDFGRHGGPDRQRAFFKQVGLQSAAVNVAATCSMFYKGRSIRADILNINISPIFKSRPILKPKKIRADRLERPATMYRVSGSPNEF